MNLWRWWRRWRAFRALRKEFRTFPHTYHDDYINALRWSPLKRTSLRPLQWLLLVNSVVAIAAVLLNQPSWVVIGVCSIGVVNCYALLMTWWRYRIRISVSGAGQKIRGAPMSIHRPKSIIIDDPEESL